MIWAFSALAMAGRGDGAFDLAACVAAQLAGVAVGDLACPLGPAVPPDRRTCRVESTETEGGPLGQQRSTTTTVPTWRDDGRLAAVSTRVVVRTRAPDGPEQTAWDSTDEVRYGWDEAGRLAWEASGPPDREARTTFTWRDDVVTGTTAGATWTVTLGADGVPRVRSDAHEHVGYRFARGAQVDATARTPDGATIRSTALIRDDRGRLVTAVTTVAPGTPGAAPLELRTAFTWDDQDRVVAVDGRQLLYTCPPAP